LLKKRLATVYWAVVTVIRRGGKGSGKKKERYVPSNRNRMHASQSDGL
jgi:hypothetical protein